MSGKYKEAADTGQSLEVGQAEFDTFSPESDLQAVEPQPEESKQVIASLWQKIKENASNLKNHVVEVEKYRKTVNFAGKAAVQAVGVHKAAAISAIANSAAKNGRGLIHGVRTDISESETKRFTKASLYGAIAVQLVGLTRIASIMVPYSSIKTFEATGSPLKAAGVSAASFGIWTATVGSVINNAVNQLPKTIDTAGDNFPRTFENFSKSLPGYRSKKAEQQSQERFRQLRKLARFAGRNTSRGLTVLGVGMSPYLYTAGVEESPREERNKLRNSLVADGAIAAGLASFALASTIEKFNAQDHYPKIIAGTLGLLVLSQYLYSKRQKNKRNPPIEEI